MEWDLIDANGELIQTFRDEFMAIHIAREFYNAEFIHLNFDRQEVIIMEYKDDRD